MDDNSNTKTPPALPADQGPAAPGKPSDAPVPAQAQSAESPGATLDLDMALALAAANARSDDLTEELKAANDKLSASDALVERLNASILALEKQGGQRDLAGAHAAVFRADRDGEIPVEGGSKLYREGDLIFQFHDGDFHVLPSHVFHELFNRL